MSSTRREEIASLLAYRETNGLTYAQLAEESGVAKSTLSWWSWRLRRDARPAFTEVVVEEDAEPAKAAASPLSIVIGDFTVLVQQGFDPATLSRTLDVLAQRC